MVENILKIDSDYFDISNIDDINDYNILLLKNFKHRPNMSLKLKDNKLTRINFEEINNIRKIPIKINYNSTFNGYMTQIFPSIAIKIPNIFTTNHNSSDKINIFNSINLKEIYEYVFELSNFDKNNYVLCYTKNFNIPEKNTNINIYNINKAHYYNYYNYFYVIPQINILYNYEKIENKYLCELSGTIIN